jgi:hypothetical protein
VFTRSEFWRLPAGVVQVRVIVVGPGADGNHGGGSSGNFQFGDFHLAGVSMIEVIVGHRKGQVSSFGKYLDSSKGYSNDGPVSSKGDQTPLIGLYSLPCKHESVMVPIHYQDGMVMVL